MKKIYFHLIVAGIFIFCNGNVDAQLTVSNTLTPVQLVQQVLLGAGINAFNITYTGDTGAIGSFNGVSSNIGLAGGVLLTSGKIWNAPGPNNSCSATGCNSTAGDSMLNTIISGTTYDAAILEFDFVPIGDTVKFRYVFASEEYNEFVNSTFNDVFAFFISGPGIVGSPNIALIPLTATPVSINNVNNGNSACGVAPSGPCNNCAYFLDNTNGTTVQYDAFTTPLVALHWVIPCDTYHIKIAIADVGDCVYDSGVMLEQGSFTGGNVFLSSHTSSNDTVAVKGCTTATVLFTLANPPLNDTTIYFTIGGTATDSIDYAYLPDSIVIPAGQTVDSITIIPLLDTGSIILQTVIIGVTFPTGCSTMVTDSITILIIRPDTLHVSVLPTDTTICYGQPLAIVATGTGGYGAYLYTWDNGLGIGSNVTAYPNANTVYHLTLTDGCGHSATDSVNVTLITAPHADSPDSLSIVNCGTGYVVFSIPSTQNNPYIIHFNVGGNAIGGTDYTIFPDSVTIPVGQTTDTLYIPALHDSLNTTFRNIIFTYVACGVVDTIVFTIVNVNPMTLALTTDTTICYGQSVNLDAIVAGGHGIYTYNWTNGLGNAASHVVNPLATTTYGVNVTDSCGNVVSDSVTVNVAIPAIPSLTGALAVEGCHNGQFTITLPFNVQSNYVIHYTIGGTATNGTDYTTLADSLVITSGNNSGTIIINPIVDSTNLNNETITITIHRPSACGGDTTVTLTIVNVRPLAMTLTPDTALCLGESVQLNVSPSGGYNGYNIAWNQGLNNDSIQTVTPNNNTTYIVSISDSCGHTKTDSVHVRVIPVPLVGVTISPKDSMCNYENATIMFTDSLLLNGTSNIIFDGGTVISGSGLGPYSVNWQLPGYYTIYFTATSEKSCWTSTDTIGIYVKDCEIHVPNVFTPNGDGKNDYFYIVNMSEFPNSHLIVYNRWGLKVYESPDYKNDWNGSNVVDGTYYYILSLNTGKQLHGDITVIRGK